MTTDTIARPIDRLQRLVGAKVRDLRKSRGFTQAALAERLDLSQARLSQVENGKGSLSAEQLLVLFQLFNVGPGAFVAPVADAGAALQNALGRLGATHLALAEDTVVPDRLDRLEQVVREALVEGGPRQLAALAPVLVRHVDRLNLAAVRVALGPGLERRLDWLVDNVLVAIELTRADAPRSYGALLRRAGVVFGAYRDFAIAQDSGGPERAVDVLDRTIATKKTLEQVRADSSEISRRWRIVTSLTPDDFAEALRATYVEP